MNPLDIMLTALSSLASNKLRAALTLLGIVIGVTAVIVLISLGQGVQKSITSEFESLGTNLITVTPGSSDGDGFGAFFGSGGDEATLTLNDAYALLDPVNAPSVVAVAPEINTWARVEYGRNSDDTSILGVTAAYDDVRLYITEQGEFISPVHVRDASSVAVLGAGISESLFGLRSPVGQTIKLNDKPFTIIGVRTRCRDFRVTIRAEKSGRADYQAERQAVHNYRAGEQGGRVLRVPGPEHNDPPDYSSLPAAIPP